MTDSTRPTDALLTEHFCYTPLSLIDEIINAVNTIIYRALEAIENGLFSIPPATLGFGNTSSTEADANAHGEGNGQREGHGQKEGGAGEDIGERFKDEIENGVHRLETLLEATVDKTFDRFEIFTLRNILTVPDDLAGWMRLAHYENLTLPPPPSAPTPESILHLRRKLQATKSLNLALRSTHTGNTTLLSTLHSLLAVPPPHPTSTSTSGSTSTSTTTPSLTFLLTHQPPSPSLTLTSQAKLTTSHLPTLRALLADLRPRLETLRAAAARDGDRDGERDTNKREERRLYIESRVRKVVGPRATGDDDIGGREVGEDEIRGLEGVVGGLRGEGMMGDLGGREIVGGFGNLGGEMNEDEDVEMEE